MPSAPSSVPPRRRQPASDAGRYITGQTLLVDGGISIGAVRALPTQK